MQLFSRVTGLSAGCFLFCTRAAYTTCGGFDRRLFAAEEIAFGLTMRRLGRFVVLPELVCTSGRKLRTHGAADMCKMIFQLLRQGHRALRSREGLDIWYGRRRENPTDTSVTR